MQSQFIRIYKSVHTWTGIVAGLALFIAFYAGALTMFKEPISRWASPPSAGVESVSLVKSAELITQTLKAHPEAAKGFWLHLVSSEENLGRMEWEVAAEGSSDHDELSLTHFVSSLDDNNDVVINQVHQAKLGVFIDVLHRVVGMPVDNDITRLVMGVIAMLYALALVSGIIIFIPTLVKDMFAFRIGKNIKRMWLDAHNVVGFVSLPFHLVMAMTSIGFAFHDVIYVSEDKLVLEGQLRSAFMSALPTPDPSEKNSDTLLAPAELVAKTKALSATFEPTKIQYSGITGPRPMVRVWGNDETSIGARAWGGFLVLNPYSGDVISEDYMPRLQQAPFTTVSSFFALHFATYGGTAIKWAYFLLALAGAWLFYSGNLLWVESRHKRQRKQGPDVAQRRDTYFMACGTVGVCLGSVVGLSITIALTKWLTQHVENLSELHLTSYYSVFFISIIWAFLRGPARSSIDLLWLAAFATLAIPATSLVAVLVPSLGMWSHSSIGTLAVDIVALAGGFCFAYLAKKTHHRAYNGKPDSVWSITTSQQALA
jgi:uncharacterized iron-regulated membrane protein